MQKMDIAYLFGIHANELLHGELKTIIDEWKIELSMGHSASLKQT